MTERTLIDSRGSVCPGPVLDLFRAYRAAKDGDEVELLATDPAAEPDAKAWAKRTGNEILSVSRENGTVQVIVRFHKRPAH